MKTFRNILASLALALGVLAAPFLPHSPVAQFAPTVQAQALSDYTENNAVDFIFRAQTWTIGANFYVGLSTTACSDSATGTEVSTSATNYARVLVARSLANWAGTQSAGSTTASTGTGGVTSNNNPITFGAPSANWGTVSHFFIIDSASGAGNIILCQALTASKTVNSGDAAPSFAGGALTVTFQ